MRISSVDAMRFIAIVSIIAIHTHPFSLPEGEVNAWYHYLHLAINQIARFAVPFFFAISGYFYGIKINKGACLVLTTKKMFYRLIVLYAGWCFIYFMPYNLTLIGEHGILGPVKHAYWDVTNAIRDPIAFFFQGSKSHLWFLMSLILCIVITAVFIKMKAFTSLIVVSLALYIIGVLAKAYSDTEVGLDTDFNTRNGPFFGLLLFVTGYWLSFKRPTVQWFYLGGVVFTIGMLMHFAEIFILMRWYGTSMLQDFVFGTYFMGVGVTLIALSNHRMLSNDMFANLGRLTLGIYASHFIFIDLLKPVDKVWDHPLWEVSFVIVVLVLSIVLTKLLLKSRYTQRLVE